MPPAAPRRVAHVLRPFLALGRFLSSPWRRQRTSGGPHETQATVTPATAVAVALPSLHPDLVSAVLAAAADFEHRPQGTQEAQTPFWRDSPIAAAVKDERKLLEAVRSTMRKAGITFEVRRPLASPLRAADNIAAFCVCNPGTSHRLFNCGRVYWLLVWARRKRSEWTASTGGAGEGAAGLTGHVGRRGSRSQWWVRGLGVRVPWAQFLAASAPAIHTALAPSLPLPYVGG